MKGLMMNTFVESQAFRSRPLRPAMASLVPLVLAFLAPVGTAAAGDARFPDLGDCQQLRVEDGSKVSAYLFGVGTQNYQWNGDRWVFIAPEAMLFADTGYHGLVAVHFAGPTWQSNSGSLVVAGVVDRCTPDPDSIPWLLLKKVATQGPGIFERVTFVQRLNTRGGNAPAVPGDHVGQFVKVPYTADYVFYH
jgi:hypothetical protein